MTKFINTIGIVHASLTVPSNVSTASSSPHVPTTSNIVSTQESRVARNPLNANHPITAKKAAQLSIITTWPAPHLWSSWSPLGLLPRPNPSNPLTNLEAHPPQTCIRKRLPLRLHHRQAPHLVIQLHHLTLRCLFSIITLDIQREIRAHNATPERCHPLPVIRGAVRILDRDPGRICDRGVELECWEDDDGLLGRSRGWGER